MDTAFKTESDLNPVPNSVTVSGDSATIKGYFFGNNQGSVKIAGRTATITSWSDRTITLTVPGGTKYTELEYIVTREDGKNGRNFAAFRLGQKEGETGYEDVPGYEEIPISDISYKIDGNTVKTERLLPIRMAVNDDGILVLLTDEEDEGWIKRNKLQFYSFKTKQWSTVGTNGNTLDVGLEEEYASIVGRGHKFYMLAATYVDTYDVGSMTYLIYGNNSIFTYDTTEDSCTCTCSKQVTDGSDYDRNIGSALGLGDSDKLYMAFGTRRTDTKIRELDPETGTLTIADNMGDLPGDYNKAAGSLGGYIVMAMPSAGQFLISGKNQIVAGIQSMLGRANEQQPGSPPSRAAVRNPNGTWKMSSASAFKMLDPEQSYNQNQLAAYGATDQGFIMAGPAQNIGTEDMVDTWAYMASSDSYVPLAPRVDSDRMRAQAGASYGGKFYVMGNSRARGNKLFLKYLDLSKVGLTSSDHAHDLHYHASSEATCTASGNSEYWSCSSCSLYFSDAAAKMSCDANSWIIPPKGHNLTAYASSEATCTASGNSEYWSCPACGKFFSDEACTNEISADSWISAPPKGHSLTHHTSSEATCTASGNSEYWSCSACGKYFDNESGTNEISADSWMTSLKGHSLTHHASSEATCTASGNSEYWSCSACAKFFSDEACTKEISKDSWITSPLGHSLTHHASSAATCTASGNSEYWSCSACAKFFSDEACANEISADSWMISAEGHSLTHYASSAATTEKAGNKEYWYCSRCGKYFLSADATNECKQKDTIIPKLPKDNPGGNPGGNEPTVPDKCENHQFTKKVVDILPTDEKPGSYHLECPVCGESDGVQYRIYRLRIGIRKKVVYRNNISKLKFNIQGMSEGADYVVEYPTNGNKIGRHKAKIIFRGQFSELGARKVRYKVIPRGTKIKKLSSKNHRIIVTFARRRRQTSGYQIRYSLNPNMKKSKKIIVTNHNKRRKQIRKLRNNRKYYIQVRTYKKVGTKKKFRRYFSKWSETESIKVKKNSRTVNNVVLRKLVDKIMSIGYNNTCR